MNHNLKPSSILNRVRAEYLEMPGLTLRCEQLQRLCGLNQSACREVLDTLVGAGFLQVRDDGSYARLRDADTTRVRPAKATLETGSAPATRLRRRAS